jgi:hypothetical protein
MTRYAANTSVSTERTRREIERTLQRYGATSFAYGWEGNAALIGFQMTGRRVRFILPLPNRSDRRFTHTPTGYLRTKANAEKEYEQACRARWRALALVVKAKLEAVESGITTFEDEFLAHILLPDGRTYGEFAVPQIDAVYASGVMPRLLPGLTPSDDVLLIEPGE